MARTWAEQIVPAPPVQKTTLLSGVVVSFDGEVGLFEQWLYASSAYPRLRETYQRCHPSRHCS